MGPIPELEAAVPDAPMQAAATRDASTIENPVVAIAAGPPPVLPREKLSSPLMNGQRRVRHPRHPWAEMSSGLIDRPLDGLCVFDPPALQKKPTPLDLLR
jgi:hypothetical protein